MARRKVPEGIRPTRLGVWFVVLSLVIGLAATNTGNNALYMVLALMLGTLVVSGVASRNNVRKVDIEVVAPEEVFAGTSTAFRVVVRNRSRILPRWLLLVSLSGPVPSRTLLFMRLARRGAETGLVELVFPQRGRHLVSAAHLSSLFPVGLFRKGMRQRLDCEVLVFPRLEQGAEASRLSMAAVGATQDRQRGWGHDLHSLRAFRPGDDPRRIHWKQTARTGQTIFMERQAERSRRVSVIVDNALDRGDEDEAKARLERRISEGAGAAVEHLKAGFQVELVTRSERMPFAGGERQRRRILETLALLDAVPPAATPLAGGAGSAQVRFDGRALGAA